MADKELEYFQRLKQEIADTYKKVYPSCDIPIEDWTSQDITNFQEELLSVVKGQISEKWFYTHIKGTQDKIPRLDMLNMLSEYVGHKNWREYTSQFASSTPAAERKPEVSKSTSMGVLKKIGLILTPISIFVYLMFFNGPIDRTYRFCFIDADLKQAITGTIIEISILNDNESPIVITSDSNGCFQLVSSERSVRFAVNSPYHKPDTITRYFSKNNVDEIIRLKTDDYALMIHMFSTSNVKDWRKRRAQLDDMIADNARIFQVYPGTNSGMEYYNKSGFINKLTTPIKSLKNIEVLEVQYNGDQISSMRFIQKEEQE